MAQEDVQTMFVAKNMMAVRCLDMINSTVTTTRAIGSDTHGNPLQHVKECGDVWQRQEHDFYDIAKHVNYGQEISAYENYCAAITFMITT